VVHVSHAAHWLMIVSTARRTQSQHLSCQALTRSVAQRCLYGAECVPGVMCPS
jgi:hypothetical protein